LGFFVSHSSELIQQIESYPLVNLTFSNTKDFSFLSARGFAEIVQDKEKQEEL
jgi:general stress protein 26